MKVRDAILKYEKEDTAILYDSYGNAMIRKINDIEKSTLDLKVRTVVDLTNCLIMEVEC